MSKSNGTLKVTMLTFVGMTCALVASIRNIPDVAATGWAMFFFMIIATFLYAFPITLISGEYAGMLPKAGGPELWVTTALGEKWGFVTSWLLWVQMFPGMVMVASVLAPMLGEVFNNNKLGLNNVFTLVTILVVYWIITILNLFFDMAKVGGKIGIWLGLYIPIVIMFIMGIVAFFKIGIDVHGILGHFSWSKAFPDSNTYKIVLQYFAPILFIYSGIEMSSVFIPRLNNPVKTYLRGIFIALIFMLVFNTVNAFLIANVIPNGKIELNNISQAIGLYCDLLGWPHWITNVFSALVFVGVAVQLSAWASGPSKTITASARRGLYPPNLKYWKTNKYGVSRTVILTQSCIISLFALLYLLIPAINNAFLMLVNSTTVIYCLVYILMGIGILRLRKTQPEMARPFRIGGKKGTSNFLIWLVVIILFATIFISVGLTLAVNPISSVVGIVVITVVLFLLPLWIVHIRKDSWRTSVDAELAKEELVVKNSPVSGQKKVQNPINNSSENLTKATKVISPKSKNANSSVDEDKTSESSKKP